MIRAAARRIRAFFGTMTGQIFVLLTLGIALAAIVSLLVAQQVRRLDFERYRQQRVVASAADIAARVRHDPDGIEKLLVERRIMGANVAPAGIAIDQPNEHLRQLLIERFGPESNPEAGQVPTGLCFPTFQQRSRDRAAGLTDQPDPDCWIVRFTDSDGKRIELALDLPRMARPPGSIVSPLYVTLILCFSALLSILVARLVSRPWRRLEQAAESFSLSLDPEPIPERGPEEVRAALSTFNLMQQRVRAGYHERTQLLAAITHDLQTPLTRLRLRLEQVDDPALRARLVQDQQAMLQLVREGLDLAASADVHEDWSVVDIDSLLASMAEDAQELGQKVVFAAGCGGTARVKLNALRRCLGNLVDNAVTYGGSAELRCARRADHLVITIDDSGAGVPEERLEQMFEPFKRGVASQPGGRAGTGIGLTIARSLAMTFGGAVRLENRPEGGLRASIEWKAQG